MKQINEQPKFHSISAPALQFDNTANPIPLYVHRIGSWQLSLQRLAYNTDELAERYDRLAPRWQRTLHRLRFPRAYLDLLKAVLAKEQISTETGRTRVLECGIGTGELSAALARILLKPFTLDAIDISSAMLERAERRFANTQIDITTRQGDMRELPYTTGTFDLAMTSHVLEHLPDPRTALKEMARVLKPGGLFVACLTRRSTLGLLVQLKWRTHRVTPNQLTNWLSECNFEQVRCLPLAAGGVGNSLSLACIARTPTASNQTIETN